MAMTIFSTLYRNIVWIAPILLCFSLFLLISCIRTVVRLVREAPVVTVPLVEEQNVTIPRAGTYVLCLDGPRFSKRFFGLTYELTAEDGRPVETHRRWFLTTTVRVTTMRSEKRRCEIPEPGTYTLRIGGLGQPQEQDEKLKVIFATPHLAQVIGCVLGMILGAGVFIPTLVFFLLRLLGKGPVL